MSGDLRSSALALDLAGEMHDGRYRAMTYLAARGGPAIEGRADDVESVRAQAGRALSWLLSAPQGATLADAYVDYRDRWSPVFPY